MIATYPIGQTLKMLSKVSCRTVRNTNQKGIKIMTPFFAVLDHDVEDIYVCLYADRDIALAYADSDDPCDAASIDGVFDAESCNEYLKAHNGYLAEIFEGHIIC